MSDSIPKLIDPINAKGANSEDCVSTVHKKELDIEQPYLPDVIRLLFSHWLVLENGQVNTYINSKNWLRKNLLYSFRNIFDKS